MASKARLGRDVPHAFYDVRLEVTDVCQYELRAHAYLLAVNFQGHPAAIQWSNYIHVPADVNMFLSFRLKCACRSIAGLQFRTPYIQAGVAFAAGGMLNAALTSGSTRLLGLSGFDPAGIVA